METESNSGLLPSKTPAASHSIFNQQTVSHFQSGFVNSSFEMIPLGNYFGVNNSVSMSLSGRTNIISNYQATTPASNSSSLLFDSVPPFNYENGSLPVWLLEEQCILEKGLVRYINDPNIMKYIKIAATLPDKTVRDVALRCWWMMRKRRKPDESNMGKRLKERKDTLMESSSTFKNNSPLVSSLSMAPYSFMMHYMDRNGHGFTTNHLLEENARVFQKIIANFSTYKLQDNIDLFCQTRNNITAILNNMNEMPGVMSPLPVHLNEDLADAILPNTTQTMMYGSPSIGIHMKRERSC